MFSIYLHQLDFYGQWLFYNGKNFCLPEKCNLKISQFLRQTCIIEGKSVGVYEYHKFGSKNRQGGFNNLNVENKVVRQFENTTESGICHVKILDKYLQKPMCFI